MKKRIVSSVLALLLGVGVPTSAFALSYAFYLQPPFVGSLVSTDLHRVDTTNSAYVNPSYSATPTNYFLSPQPYSSINATNIVTNVSTAGYRGLSYNSVYGGQGTYYALSAYPSNFDFIDYLVAGTWSP